MAINNQIRLYETRTILKKEAATGSDSVDFYVVAGSRMLVTLHVLSADPGVNCQLVIGNAFDVEVGYEALETATVVGAGNVKRILSDFYNQFQISVNVTGGTADYRVAIALYDNAGTTRIENAQLDVDLSDITDSLGHFDALRVGDGTGAYLDINEDGSINVRFDIADDEEPVNPYAESPSVPSGAETAVLTYVIPNGKLGFLYRIEASGENVARYKIKVNGDVVATRRTHHGSGLTTEFEFTTPNKRALVLEAGDIIEVFALHNRPQSGDFEARAQLLLKTAP